MTFHPLRVIYSVRGERRSKTKMYDEILKETIFKFNNLSTAINFTYRAIKMKMIILGDDELFWVVTPAAAERLVRQGYEYAEY